MVTSLNTKMHNKISIIPISLIIIHLLMSLFFEFFRRPTTKDFLLKKRHDTKNIHILSVSQLLVCIVIVYYILSQLFGFFFKKKYNVHAYT